MATVSKGGKPDMDKIEETDEMKLKMLAALDKPDPDDVFYPPELNAHLLEQLKVMTCDNNQLRKCIYTKDNEITELNNTVMALNQRIRDIISGTGPAISSKSAGIISAKITDLCKQNRHLVAEVEGYKTKYAILERKNMQLELIIKERENLDVCYCKDEPLEATPNELKELNSKLAAVNRKLYDSKNRNLELKNEILVATKILQQELGDKFTSIKELQNDLAGWKGRAQQIVLLQSRIAELEEKLEGKPKEVVNDGKRKDQNQIIKDLEMKRKKEIEQAMKDLDIIKEENQDLKKKLDAAKARMRILECDATILRQKMQTFMEKSNHDDMLINEQRTQIKNTELYYQELLKENTIKMKKMRSEIDEYQKEFSNTDAKIDALRKQASEKAAKIEELRAQLLRYEECSLQSVFFTPMKTATDNEIKQLADLVKTLNERLSSERQKWDELESSHRSLREKKKHLERKISTLTEEIKTLKESKKYSRASRMSLNSEKLDTGSSVIHGVSKKQFSLAAITEKRSDSTTITADSLGNESYEELDKSELKYKLELADEKLKIMEDKLKMVEEEKVDDYNNLTEMIQTSKQLFNEALCLLQKQKCYCST